MKKTCFFKSVIDYILLILLVILSISKGGFYKSDILLVSVGISVIAFIYTLINLLKKIKEKEYTVDIVSTLLLILSFCYLLPIIVNNYADLNSSIFEAIRYFNLYSVYNIVKKSNNKKLYIYTLIGLTLIQCVLSIDAVGNRYLENILSNFSSGFLDRDFTRMSGTLQYANVLAVLCLICIIFLAYFIYNEKRKVLYILFYEFMFILLSTLILTGSRAVFLLLILSVIFSFKIKNKYIEKKLFTYILMTISLGIYSALMYKNMMSRNVYFIFIIFLAINPIIALLTDVIYNIYISKFKEKYNFKSKYFTIFILFVTVFYFVLAFNISKPISVNDNVENNIKIVRFDNIKTSQNVLSFKVISNEVDTRYKINLNSINDKNEEVGIHSFSYTENTSGNFEYKFNLEGNVKYLKLYVKCEKGNITLDNVYLNDRKQNLDYVLIPIELIYRFKDLFTGSTSTSDRLTYYTDAMKIICRSVPNFVFGTGGEGFNNIYEQIKTKNYTSTEVHSSFLQIFVETGVIGFITIVIVIIYSIINSKNDYIKFVYILLLIHSCVDLNFSYMLIILVFGILLALLEEKKCIKLNNKVIFLLFNLISLVFALMAFFLTTRALIAMYVNVPKYDDNIDLSLQIEVVKINEKRVMLDPYEYIYRKSLDKEYDLYLTLLYKKINEESDATKVKILEDEIKNILNNVILNSDEIMRNNKYNSSQIMYACSIYFRNLKNLSKLYYSSDIMTCYNKYMNIINDKLDYLENIYINNKDIIKIIYDKRTEYSIY